MRILICIDDTDNLDSIGTGEVLENLCTALEEKGLGKSGFVTRHQLYIHEDIAYTSHNSSMCCETVVEDLEQVIDFCRSYILISCAEGSDPGLCIVLLDKFEDDNVLIGFGKSAKTMVLQKQEAYDLAACYPDSVYLSEHGGTGDGVIGALAGCGLRLSGCDGKIKGKLKPRLECEILSVGNLCDTCGLAFAMDFQQQLVPVEDTVVFREAGKAVYWQHQKAVYLTEDESGFAKWRMLGKKELPKRLVY